MRPLKHLLHSCPAGEKVAAFLLESSTFPTLVSTFSQTEQMLRLMDVYSFKCHSASLLVCTLYPCAFGSQRRQVCDLYRCLNGMKMDQPHHVQPAVHPSHLFNLPHQLPIFCEIEDILQRGRTSARSVLQRRVS